MMYDFKFIVLFAILQNHLACCSQLDNDGSKRMIGPPFINPTEVRHMVSLRKPNEQYFGSGHICSGIIITPKTILTCGHCVRTDNDKNISPSDIKVVAGTPNRLKRTNTTQVRNVRRIIVHPDYTDSEAILYNLALLKLEQELFEDGVSIARANLPDSSPALRTYCTAQGWGVVYPGGPLAADAIVEDLIVTDPIECNKIMNVFNVKGYFCAGDFSDLKRAACQYDGGGPLICNGKVYGMASFFVDSCLYMAGYVDVAYYRDWILTGGAPQTPMQMWLFYGLSILTMWYLY